MKKTVFSENSISLSDVKLECKLLLPDDPLCEVVISCQS